MWLTEFCENLKKKETFEKTHLVGKVTPLPNAADLFREPRLVEAVSAKRAVTEFGSVGAKDCVWWPKAGGRCIGIVKFFVEGRFPDGVLLAAFVQTLQHTGGNAWVPHVPELNELVKLELIETVPQLKVGESIHACV